MPICVFCDNWDQIGKFSKRCGTCGKGKPIWPGYREANNIKIYPDGVDYCLICVGGEYRQLTRFGKYGLPYLDQKYQEIWKRDRNWLSLGYPDGYKLLEESKRV